MLYDVNNDNVAYFENELEKADGCKPKSGMARKR